MAGERNRGPVPGASVAGIGVDMVEVARFRGLGRDSGLVAQFLSPAEIEDAFSRKEPAPTLAGRFAAKEAVIKAVGPALARLVLHLDIIIGHDVTGAPQATILGDDAGNLQILLSISHAKEHAVAFAMVFRKDDHDG
ncbi:MAG: holo-ACP synthase [Methanomassiliicoccus sp.]|nr:holo-ACP synthase [Methanomassiliicoccus sp.]